MLLALLKTLRPRQWIKNLFVAVPLMFGQKLTDPTSLLITAGAVALFCLISGCVYVLNDLVDVEKDRAHPKKRNRPIPSGALPEVALIPEGEEDRVMFGAATLGPWIEVGDATRNWAQLRPWILWALLLAGVGGLAWMVRRLIRGSRS